MLCVFQNKGTYNVMVTLYLQMFFNKLSQEKDRPPMDVSFVSVILFSVCQVEPSKLIDI